MQKLALSTLLRLTIVLAVVLPGATILAQTTVREKIGEVLGKAVFRDELRAAEDDALAAELRQLFAPPLLGAYKNAHAGEVTPTEREIEVAQAYFLKRTMRSWSGMGKSGRVNWPISTRA